MQDFRLDVGASLKGKFSEHGFFLSKFFETTRIIRIKCLHQEYPLNEEFDALNYFFSAYLNTIQSLKDACETATGASISWSELLPTYGNFVRYSRNAATHDGKHLINAGLGEKNYIAGPLRRFDHKKTVIEFDPPKEDALSLCCNITDELLQSLSAFLKREGSNIPVATEECFEKTCRALLTRDFVPDEVIKSIKVNYAELEASFNSIEINVVQQTLDAIELVAKVVADART